MKTDKIGLFWGSDTGVTEEIVRLLAERIGPENLDIHNVFDVQIAQFRPYRRLILGLSTWYDGQLQSDWDNFFEFFQALDFSGQEVVLFGTGDQVGYAQYFVDGMGILAEVVLRQGGRLFGAWPTEGYVFEASKAVLQEGYFVGLALDEDNQPFKTEARLDAWVAQLKQEGFLS